MAAVVEEVVVWWHWWRPVTCSAFGSGTNMLYLFDAIAWPSAPMTNLTKKRRIAAVSGSIADMSGSR